MPIVILVLAALVGVGYFAREEAATSPTAASVSVERSVDRIGPAHEAWAAACEFRLANAAREFEALQAAGCERGTVTVSQLPSGVDYVEYNLRTDDGAAYQVSVTEEPQEAGDPQGWSGAPGCKGYDRGFDVVRHEHGRLARVYASAGRGMDFARLFEGATNDCVEQ